MLRTKRTRKCLYSGETTTTLPHTHTHTLTEREREGRGRGYTHVAVTACVTRGSVWFRQMEPI